jgi:hypothetical protein
MDSASAETHFRRLFASVGQMIDGLVTLIAESAQDSTLRDRLAEELKAGGILRMQAGVGAAGMLDLDVHLLRMTGDVVHIGSVTPPTVQAPTQPHGGGLSP